MMTSDARDMMGLPSAGQSKPTPKASKPKVRGPGMRLFCPNYVNQLANVRSAGVSREVLDLNYEGAPPISIVAPKLKEKPKLHFKPRTWYEEANGSRNYPIFF